MGRSVSNKKTIFSIALIIVVFAAFYNNCSGGFKSENFVTSEVITQGSDDGGFRPLPVTTTTLPSLPVVTTTTTTTVTLTTVTTTTMPGSTTTSTTTTTSTSTSTTSTTSTSTTTTSTTTTTLPSVALVSCLDAQHQLPLATHWSNANGGSVVEGASDQINTNNADTGSSRVYFNGFLPEHEKYIGDVYSVNKFDDAEVRQWSFELCQRNGIAVEFKKPTSYSNWQTAKLAAVANRGALQILPALKVNKSLVSVILPVGWDPKAPTGSYPVIFVGAYDVHDSTRTEGQIEIAAISSLWNSKKLKAIGIVWNGMGAVASRTMNASVLSEFNEIIQRSALNFGADPLRIITFGGSRGGTTSLRLASNPNNYPYKVVAAYAAVPGDQIGTIAELTSSTIPELLSAAEWSIGLKAVYAPGWIYPNLGNSLSGLTANQAHVKILTGTSDLATANNLYSLSSPAVIQGLKNAGTQVYLEIGSHDFIVPWVTQLYYAKKLEQFGIPHELRVNYLAGHWRDNAALEQTLNRVLAQVANKSGGNYFSIGKKAYYRVDATSGKMQLVNKPMFTIEFPSKIVPGSGGAVIATGVPGTTYKVQFRFNEGSTLSESTRTLDNDGKDVWDISAVEDGTYKIEKLFIQEPGKAMAELSINRATTKYSPGVVKVEKSSTAFAGTSTELASYIRRSYLGNNLEFVNNSEFGNVSYGVCE